MGRSAKLHKPTSSAGSTAVSQPAPKPKAVAAAPTPKEQKKRAGLKAKAKTHKREGDGPVLGGADYVELMLGSRRKAKEEAAKLPKDPES
ncbi:hypothetical protein BV20DRAFT_1055491 [Pilatotrama ljubarskyi]|nr:hypothetical protein BV20DRAFT_1055491 [Pilatotrama ljubarskyi]